MAISTLAAGEVTHAALDHWHRGGPAGLRQLGEFGFFRTWPAVRLCLLLTPHGDRCQIKLLHNAVTREYRQRTDGARPERMLTLEEPRT